MLVDFYNERDLAKWVWKNVRIFPNPDFIKTLKNAGFIHDVYVHTINLNRDLFD